MCGPGRGRAGPSTICGRMVDGAGRECRRTPSSQKWVRAGGAPGQAGGRPRSHGPSQLSPASHVSRAAPPTQQPPGESGGRRPAALPREAGTEGGLRSGPESVPGCVGAGQRCRSLGLQGKHPGLGVGLVEWVPSQPCLGGGRGPRMLQALFMPPSFSVQSEC